MSQSCQPYAAVNSTLANSCAIQKLATTPLVTDALHTCCVGRGGPQTTGHGCFTYCNMNSLHDALHWEYCPLDTLGTATFIDMDPDALGCIDNWGDGTSTISRGFYCYDFGPHGIGSHDYYKWYSLVVVFCNPCGIERTCH